MNPSKLVFTSAKSFVVSLTLITLLGCVTPPSAEEEMQVELDVFSGRPNPQWALTSQEVDQFIKLLQALPQHQGEASTPEGLGYRGLIVTQPGETIDGYSQISIANSIVTVEHNGELEQLADKDRALEQWLFQTGKDELDATLYQQIGAQIK